MPSVVGSASLMMALMTIILLAAVAQVSLAEPDNLESKLGDIFDDTDPELKQSLGSYLDNVPSSHRTQTHASRCFLLSGIKHVINDIRQGKHLKAVLNMVLSSKSTENEDVKEEMCQDSCGDCPKVEPCMKCPVEDCSECPPCPISSICIPAPNEKCPPKPKCPDCETPSTTMKPTTAESSTTSAKPTTTTPKSTTTTSTPTTTTSKPTTSTTTTTSQPATTSTTKQPASPSRNPLKYDDDCPCRKNLTSMVIPSSTRKPYPSRKPSKRPPLIKLSTTKKSTTRNPIKKKTTTTTTTGAPSTSTSTTPPKRTTTVKAVNQTTTKGGWSTDGLGMTMEMNKQITSSQTTKITTSTGSSIEATITQNINITGVAMFQSNLNLLVQNETLRQHILEMMGAIPETTGGAEWLSANRLLSHFGENFPDPIQAGKRGHGRSFTFRNAKINAITIMGHVMDRFKRKKCSCAPCEVAKNCDCPPLQKCTRRPHCPPCKQICPAPPECTQYPPCPKCSSELDPDDDGDLAALDDVDMENTIRKEDLYSSTKCKGFACEVEKTCGKADKNPLSPKGSQSGYMNGGEDEVYGEFPQFARLDIDMPSRGTTALCGGVLISNRHILTAQHCVRTPPTGSDGNSDKLEPKNIKVTLADHNRDRKDEFEVERGVSGICFSKNFRNTLSGSRYDFAILTLDQNVTFNDNIQPACLPHRPLDLKSTTKCFVVGLGITKFSPIGAHSQATIVQKMRVNRVSCKSWGIKHDDRSRYCFTKAGDKGDTCGGDSGGPVICLNKSKRWTAMGLVSYGSEACDGTEAVGWVGVYTRIPTLMKEMQDNCGL